MNLYALILAGGSGTRLWPLSREEMPKQFLAVCGNERTLLQQTALRLLKLTDASRIRVVASAKWRALVAHQFSLIKLDGDFVVEEPEARNTAPAIALGISALIKDGAADDDVIFACPSDHIIEDERAFEAAAQLAAQAASAGSIVTLGIKPTAPETGFGYIKTKNTGAPWLEVLSFVEKPDAATARKYVEAGDYYWNGGIFCFTPRAAVQAYRDCFPEGAGIFGAPAGEEAKYFAASPALSIDYAVMERAGNIACVPLDAGWSDVGSWDAVYENSKPDGSGNVTRGNVSLHGGNNNLVVGGERLICAMDINSMIVIDTPDALFVAPRGSSQKLRELVKELAKSHHDEVIETPASARPWGTYSVLSKGERHKIKRIVVSPGGSLSLQYHLHRSEHWIVVQGTARMTIYNHGEEPGLWKLVHEGESIFVPKGFLHRMENPGHIPLEIIEVQIGEYVGEDDIKRVSDNYGRVKG